jgi:hypothetical protein
MPGVDPISSVASAVDDSVKLVAQKDQQQNTPDMKAAAMAQEVQNLKDEMKAALEKGDLDEIRRLCS